MNPGDEDRAGCVGGLLEDRAPETNMPANSPGLEAEYIRVYLDTEFTDFCDLELISLGLVSDEGDEFYAEVRDINLESCNAFVSQTVLPLLRKKPEAVMPRDLLQRRLLEWLEHIKRNRSILVVSYDFFGDYVLLVEAIGAQPAWLRGDNIVDRISEAARANFWRTSALPQHHALNDARALRFAHRIVHSSF